MVVGEGNDGQKGEARGGRVEERCERGWLKRVRGGVGREEMQGERRQGGLVRTAHVKGGGRADHLRETSEVGQVFHCVEFVFERGCSVVICTFGCSRRSKQRPRWHRLGIFISSTCIRDQDILRQVQERDM